MDRVTVWLELPLNSIIPEPLPPATVLMVPPFNVNAPETNNVPKLVLLKVSVPPEEINVAQVIDRGVELPTIREPVPVPAIVNVPEQVMLPFIVALPEPVWFQVRLAKL